MLENIPLPFSLPSVQRKKVTAAFDGGRMSSDGGVMLLAAVENSLGIATKLAALIADPRNSALVTHSVADILRARMLAIACGDRRRLPRSAKPPNRAASGNSQQLHLFSELSVVFMDTTTLAFTGTGVETPGARGYSKGHRPDLMQLERFHADRP